MHASTVGRLENVDQSGEDHLPEKETRVHHQGRNHNNARLCDGDRMSLAVPETRAHPGLVYGAEGERANMSVFGVHLL